MVEKNTPPEPEKKGKKTGPKPGAAPKKRDTPVDWPAIEALYRAGLLTVSDIAKMHGISHPAIHQRAKKHGWTRDLGDIARRIAKDKLAQHGQGVPAKPNPPSPAPPKKPDPELPDGWTPPPREPEPEPPPQPQTPSDVDFEGIVQNAAGTIVAIVRQHRAGLKRLNGFSNDLMDRVEGLMPGIKTLGHTYDAAALLDSLVRTYERVVKMERQAFGVDDPTIKHQHTGPDGNPLPAGVDLGVLDEDDLFALRGAADKMARRRSQPRKG